MNSTLIASIYECPERRTQGPLLMNAMGPQGAFVAQRAIGGAWTRLPAMPSTLQPAWAEVDDELAREVLYVGACAALWPGMDPWLTPPAPRPSTP